MATPELPILPEPHGIIRALWHANIYQSLVATPELPILPESPIIPEPHGNTRASNITRASWHYQSPVACQYLPEPRGMPMFTSLCFYAFQFGHTSLLWTIIVATSLEADSHNIQNIVVVMQVIFNTRTVTSESCEENECVLFLYHRCTRAVVGPQYLSKAKC